MGEIVDLSSENEVRTISGKVIGTDMVQEITIIKNSLTLHTFQGKGRENPIHYLDKTPQKEGDYYYLRVIQHDGEMAWSSPIWFESRGHAQ
jgi:hypothetical protein